MGDGLAGPTLKGGQRQVYNADVSDLDLNNPVVLGVYSRMGQPADIAINSMTASMLSVEFTAAMDSKMVGNVVVADLV